MAVMSGPEVFVELCNRQGVDTIFYNPGFDVVPLLSAAARARAAGLPAPRTVMCLDEATALHAAHGHYLVSGRPQVLLVHAELGTQQVGGAIQQAWYGKVPVVICAADMVAPGRVNWRGESYDQAMMLRNCLRWDHKVEPGESFYAALQESFRRALQSPPGPVYLTYSMDALLETRDYPIIEAASPESLPPVDDRLLEQAAAILLQASKPLIMTGYSGRQAGAVNSLVDLAETLGCRVVTSGVRMNFPSDHPLCANLEPNDGLQTRPYFLSADAVLVIDYDIPYAYPRSRPPASTRLIHIDIDFEKQGEILWDRVPEVSIRADSWQVVPLLTALLQRQMTPDLRAAVQKRAASISNENLALRREWQEQGRRAGLQDNLSAEWVAYCLNQVIDPATIIVNQTIPPAGAISRQIPRSRPGTSLACAGGTIGWALGAALGAKLAAADKLVVALMGDGAFVYGGPTAAFWPAARYQAPFLTVVFNNQAYGAIKSLFQGELQAGIEDSLIAPSPSYALVAEAGGAFGRVVEKPADVLPVLQEAVSRVRAGQAAVVDVRWT